MKKYIATLVGFLCALAFIQSQAQCINPDTTSYHRVRDRLPGAVAFNSNKVAVASYDTSQHGIHSRVLVWNDQFYFVGGQHADDSVTVTGPCAVAFDTSGKLYVLQTLRPDQCRCNGQIPQPWSSTLTIIFLWSVPVIQDLLTPAN